MMCGKCASSKLCPVSFGIGVGLTCFFAVLIWSLWVLQYGVPVAMTEHLPVPDTLSAGFVLSLWSLLKGFIGGFFVALFYDLCLKCKRCCCKGKVCGGCGCTPSECRCSKPNSTDKM